MFLVFFSQSICLASATFFLLLTSNSSSLLENTLLSFAVFYCYLFSQQMHKTDYWLPLLIVAGILCFSPNIHSVLLLILSFFTLVYFIQHRFSFRKITLLKNVTVALCWSLLVAVPDTREIFQLGASVFFTTLGLSICIDLAQKKEDLGKIITLPHVLGNNGSFFFALVFALLGHLFLPTPLFASILALSLQAGLTYISNEKLKESLREVPYLLFALSIYLA